jgi:hypothetical protein
MALLSTALVTADEASAFLGDSTMDETILEMYVNAATLRIEQHCRRKFVKRAISEQVRYPDGFAVADHIRFHESYIGSPRVIYLDFYPVDSVISIQDPAGNTVPATDYVLHPDQGMLRIPGAWSIPVNSDGNAAYYTIIYSGGMFGSTEAVPGDLKAACLFLLKFMAHGRDTTVRSKSVGDMSLSYDYGTSISPGLPDSVVGLLNDSAYVRPRV